jgi:hypothetical protein
LDLRGFKGDYRITTTHNNQTVTADLTMKNDLNQTILLFPVGTKPVLTEVNITVFPNPVSDYLSLELPFQNNWNVMILDATGKVLYRNTTTDSIQFLDFRNYASGTYFVRVQDENGVSVVKKVVRK